MPPRTTQNPSALIRDVPVLDGTSVSFPAWRTRLEDLFAIQGVHDIVTGKLALPEADHKDAKPITQGSQRVYYAEESGTNWDALSDVARATLKMTIHLDLAIRYKDLKPVSLLFKTICDAYEKNTRARRMMLQDSFWCARHDPSQPIARWIAKVRNTASDLKSVKLTPADQQICDRLLRGLDDTWKPIRDHLVYSPNEISLDNAIGALEAHEVSTIPPTLMRMRQMQNQKRSSVAGDVARQVTTRPPAPTHLSDSRRRQQMRSRHVLVLRQWHLLATVVLAMMKTTVLTKKSKYIGDEKPEVEEPFILRKHNSGTT
ncbi:hypothetical protein KEM48_007713 [Puccinia striiformis f. sp. tritici PST-130]|nr:hypothetical protein KEM48_007713 [Puccinia striiformis f. sp. tritici PST-130]